MKPIRLIIILLLCALGFANPSLMHANGPTQAQHVVVAQTPNPQANKRLWNLQNADIRAVIAAISRETGKNFVIDPRVRGNVTIVSSTPISADEAYQVFLSALQVLGYAAVPSGQIIKIVPSVNAKGLDTPITNPQNPGVGDEMVVRVIPVRNVSAAQLVAILRPLMPEWSNVSAYAPANSLILAGRASNIARLAKIVKRVDTVNTNQIEMIPLHYASADKLVAVLDSLLAADRGMGKSANISLAADKQGNSILMSGSRTDRLRLKVLISQLDAPSAAGSGNTRVIPLNYLQAKVIAPILANIAHASYLITSTTSNGTTGTTSGLSSADIGVTSGANTGQSTGSNNQKAPTNKLTVTSGGTPSKNISIEAENSSNAIIISAPPAMMRTLTRVIKRLDVRPSQVLVEAVIAEVSDSVVKNLGIEWGSLTSSTSGSDATPSTNTATTSTFQQGFGIIHSGDFAAVINALSTNDTSNILSTPSVVVLNNKTALISVGKNIGLVNRSYAATTVPNGGDNSAFPFNTIQRTPVALSLEVTPQISPDNSVRLEIEQKNDTLPATDNDNPSANQVINTSSLQTTVLVNSGDILVIGGLKNHNNTDSGGKVPIIGDIPVLGKLFHFKKKSAEKKNLMIFLKPIILDSRQANNRVSYKSYREIRQVQLNQARYGGQIHQDDTPILAPLGKPVDNLPAPFTYR